MTIHFSEFMPTVLYLRVTSHFMSETDLTHPKVFIIESLTFENEQNGYFEGEVISKILNFSDIEHKYYYIRTKSEFVHLITEFKKLNFRYLHISCHGNSSSLATTLESIPFNELSFILQNVLDRKRLFISACSATNDKLADEIFGLTECYSIIGPDETINIDDAAIFWASFYHLMFKQNGKAMKKETLQPTLNKLVALHNVPLKYYSSSKSNSKGWKEVSIK